MLLLLGLLLATCVALTAVRPSALELQEPLRRALRLLSPDHATAWADALRYAVAGKRCGAFSRSALFDRICDEWTRRLGAAPPAEKRGAVEDEPVVVLPPVSPPKPGASDYPLVDGLLNYFGGNGASNARVPEPPARETVAAIVSAAGSAST